MSDPMRRALFCVMAPFAVVRRFRGGGAVIGAVGIATFVGSFVGWAQPAPRGEWRWHSGDAGSMRYAALDQITKDNVSRLAVAWRRPAVDPSLTADNYSHDFRATPL